jgi:hypothetical protein
MCIWLVFIQYYHWWCTEPWTWNYYDNIHSPVLTLTQNVWTSEVLTLRRNVLSSRIEGEEKVSQKAPSINRSVGSPVRRHGASETFYANQGAEIDNCVLKKWIHSALQGFADCIKLTDTISILWTLCGVQWMSIAQSKGCTRLGASLPANGSTFVFRNIVFF